MILRDEETVGQEIWARKDRNKNGNGHKTGSGAQPGNGSGGSAGKAPRSLKEIARRAAQEAEREAILEALRLTGWNRGEAARRLEISYKALLYKMKECGVKATNSSNGS